jgi:multidrug efflux pump subunit AcrB
MTITLCSSLLVTWTFLPLFSFYILKVPKKIKKPSADSNRGFIRYYRSIVRLAIHHRKWVLAGASIVLLLGFYLGSTLKASFFPEDLSQFSYADIWLPQDVATSSTSQKAEQVGAVIKREASRYETEILGKKWIKKHPEGLLKMLDTFVGTGSPRFWYSLAPQAPQKNYAQIVMELSDKWQTESFLAFCQKAVDAEIAGARVDMRQLEAGSSVGVPISLRVSGEDIPTLRKIASKVQAVIAADPKARHVFQDWGNDRFFVQLNVDSDRAALSGLTHEDIANAFSTSLDGLTMTYLREGDKQIPVVSKLAMQERTSPSSLDSFYVYPSSSGSPVQLGQFSTQTVKMGPAMIYRYNQFRTVQVQAFAAPGSLPSEVLKDIGPAIKKIETELPPGYKIVYGGSIEEQNDSSAPLPMVLGISLISIFMALVFQFKSAIKPFIVFSAIPFGVCGAMLGLWIMKTSFGFMAFLGIISLIGVIVSHIIVLFDFIEGAHDRGEPLEDALLNAGTERLRPVLITVGATVFALLPLSFHGGPLWQSLCYAQMGGLTAATLITLILVPVIYTVFVKDLKWVHWEEKKTDRNQPKRKAA